ncbi:Metallo-dependent phosphatase-like protein [Jimgerdemannia flammicorona]|uniref:Endopolyphosphatase n=1 Tax=Jimgerdemannia flammicorona TaxID=994334 RepID=A0A433QC73_9FUNG|nr:Metallo-dependent phosphatase-like protein [Jimgerdemannia flammicorona]
MRPPALLPLLPALLLLADLAGAAPDTRQAAFAKTQPRKLHGNFLHITDFHPDKWYRPGAKVKDSCHKLHKKKLLDKEESRRAGTLGTPASSCDSPYTLIDATFEWIRKEWKDKIDFVVWTGDNARHDSDNRRPRTKKEILNSNRYITTRFLETFAPTSRLSPSNITRQPETCCPIVASIGNNDVYPHNILDSGPKNPTLNAFLGIWEAFIPEEQVHTFQEGGWYSVDVIPGLLKVLSLNTMYFYKSNAAVDGCDDHDDPGTQEIEWIEAELQKAEKNHMKVYLTGHVPPKRKNYFPSCWHKYGKLSLKYRHVIIGHLFGHVNLDHFFLLSKKEIEGHKISRQPEAVPEDWERTNRSAFALPVSGDLATQYSDSPPELQLGGARQYLEQLFEQYSSIKSGEDGAHHVVINISPSVVPTFNPTFRIFHYEVQESAQKNQRGVVPLGYTQYFANLTKWNEKAKGTEEEDADADISNPPPWLHVEYEVEYSTMESYGMRDLSVASWLKVARELGDGKSLWRDYVRRMYVQTRNGLKWP